MSTVEEKGSRELDHGYRFYQKMAELQEKLKKSEEERLKLEEKFRILVRSCREEEDAKLTMLKAKYEKFLDDEKKRRERNDRILQTLDRIESRTVMLTSKSERLQLMRKHYEAYLASMYPAWTENHQGQMANKIKTSPLQSNSRHERFTNDVNKDSRFPLTPVTPVKASVFTPSYLPSPALDQRVSTGYSSTQPLANTNPRETLGVSPHREYLLSGQHTTPSRTPSSYQQFSPYNQIIPNSLPSQYSGAVPTFSSPDLKHHDLLQSSTPQRLDPYCHLTSATQNASQDIFENPLHSDSFNYRDKRTLPSSANTIEEKYKEIIKSDNVSPHKNTALSDCISNAAELLNYKVKGEHGLHSTTHRGAEESKLAMSLDNELEQNTSGDPLCLSLSDDSMLNQDEALNNEGLLEAGPERKEVSSHMEITPVCKELTVENPVSLPGDKKVTTVKQDAKIETPGITAQGLLHEKKPEMVSAAKTKLLDSALTTIDGVRGNPIEYGQGDAVTGNNYHVNKGPEYNPPTTNNNGSSNHDNLLGAEGLNTNTENIAHENSLQHQELQENPVNEEATENHHQTETFYGGDSETGHVEGVQAPITGQAYEEQQQPEYIPDEGQGQAPITGQAYEEQQQPEYIPDEGQGYVDDSQTNVNHAIGEVYDEQQQGYTAEGQAYVEDGQGQLYDEQQQLQYAADDGQGYVEDGQGQVYDEQKQLQYAADDGQGYVEDGQGQVYDEQQQLQYAADDGQGYVEDGQGQVYNEQQQLQYAADDGQGYVEDSQGQVYDEQQQLQYAADDGQAYVEDGQGQVYDEQQQLQYAADDGQGYVEDGQGQVYDEQQQLQYTADGQAYVEDGQGQVYDEQQQLQYAADDGQYYTEDGQAIENYVAGQAYDEQQPLEYAADDGTGYVEDVQANADYVEGQTYEEQETEGHVEGELVSQENPSGESYAQPGDQDHSGGTLGDDHQTDQGDQQYFQGGKYHEPTVGYETGNVNNTEENVAGNALGEAGVFNESSTEAVADAEQLIESQQEGDSELLEQSSKSREVLDDSEINTSTSSSEFNKQNESNEFEPDVNSVKESVDGENRMGGNPSKPKVPGLAMLESDSDSAVLDTVGMVNDDSDFDFSENK